MAEGQDGGQDLAFILNDLNARIRVLENKYNLFGERLLIVNQNMIEEYKKLMRNIKAAESDVSDIKKEVFHIKEVLGGLTKELSVFAKKDSLHVLEKYINLWNPMNLVTEKDVANIIKHNEELVFKEDLEQELRIQRREILEAVRREIDAAALSKKEAEPEKSENERDAKQRPTD